MDKYQAFIINKENTIFEYINDIKKEGIRGLKDNGFEIVQDEDITVEGYMLYISNRLIDSVKVISKGKEKDLKTDKISVYYQLKGEYVDQTRFYLPISFDDKFDSIKISFKNNYADDLIIPLIYKDADKDKYYEKIRKENQEELIKKAKITHSTGISLINILFQPCSKDYYKTEISLYSSQGSLMAKYDVNKGAFFKSISGLAYGTYYYDVIQFDKTGIELIHTDRIKVVLSSPNYSGRPYITIK